MFPNQNIPVFNPSLEVDLIRGITRQSFYRFVQEFWHIAVGAEHKPIWNWHIKKICDEVQKMFLRVERGEAKEHDLIINIPPGCTKSTIFSLALPAWIHCRMPHARFITASFSHDLATDFGLRTKQLMNSDLYRKCFGKFRFTPDRMGFYTNQYMGQRLVFTTNTSPTGQHAHFVIIDDPVDPMSVDREVQIHNVNMWMNRVVGSRTVDARVTPFILVMQRLSENDPTGDWLLKNENVRHIRLPASLDDGTQVFPVGWEKHYKDGLLDPIRLPKTVLEQRKKTMSKADYLAQYQQEPIPAEGLMFKVQKLQIVPCEDPLDPVIAKVRYWDKAVSTNANACFTVGCLMGRTASGRFIILDVVRKQWGAKDREDAILTTTRGDGPHVVVGLESEPGSGGLESAAYTVRNLAGFKVFVDRVQHSKVMRAEPFAIQVEHGNVSVKQGNWNTDFLAEVAAFPRGRFMDQVDASVGAFNALAKAGHRIAGAL